MLHTSVSQKRRPDGRASGSRRLIVVDCGVVDYERASVWQEGLHRTRVAGDIDDVLLMLEHPNVYTMGRRSAEEHLLMDPAQMRARGVRLHRADRGGSITFHGPGQLVAYPIVDLRRDETYFVDVIKYVRLLEQAVIDSLELWGISSGRREGMTGVWVENKKVAAIGVRISRGVAKHGVAINVSPDLELFKGIVPCGLATEGVTSMERLLGRTIGVAEVRPALAQQLSSLLDLEPVIGKPADIGLTIVDEPQAPATRTPRPPRPVWLKTRVKTGPNYGDLKNLVRGLELNTVCEEAGCPNIYECWEAREATFLILGKQCTRRCGFCDIATGKPGPLDLLEPARVAQAVDRMGLNYAVITGVERDDVSPAAAAEIWAATIRVIRQRRPACSVEVLTGDLKGDRDSLRTVLEARPEVFAHNLETVRRLHRAVRPGFRYERSLEVLRVAKQLRPDIPTKSNLILGLGETREEVVEALADLRNAQVDLVTLGQYLAPSDRHLPVQRWVTPEEFGDLKQTGEGLGFAWVESGPLVRSSYHAGKQYGAAAARLAERSASREA